jgi:hypothetical protein
MIRLLTPETGGELQLPGLDISLEIANPYFDTESIPGITSLPTDLPETRDNLRFLNSPHLFRGVGGPPPVPAHCYLDGVLWQPGQLVFRGRNVAARTLRYNFTAGAAALQTEISGRRLPELDLRTVPFSADFPASTAWYALAPVRNAAFFGDKNPAFKGVLNYCGPGGTFAAASASQVYAPLPCLLPVLDAVVATFGYTITGPWRDLPEVQQLVLYSDRALATGATEVLLARHLPDITIGELLIALQNTFCLGVYVDTRRRELRITPLREVASGTRRDYLDRAGTLTEAGVNETAGFVLRLEPDSTDELDKTLPIDWQQFKVGAGQEVITVKAGTLHQVREVDALLPTRHWLLPAIEGKGASPEYELGEDSRTGLRLLYLREGHDSNGQPYPLATGLAEDYDGSPLAGATSTLQWAGTGGLYGQWHQPWLDFRARAVPRTYKVSFRIADLLTLDPARPDRLDEHLLLWQKVTLTVSADRRLTTATITYQELL